MGKHCEVTRFEEHAIKNRLVACMPASRFEMETLCRLTDIRITRKLPSAAVECIRRPRLLINPDFVEKYCQRDEHLFLLIMHELWHVMLGHTRMYPRMSQAHNIAFDAVINAGLMRYFSQPEYRGFFEAVNPDDRFPHCLLRPPKGWPRNPEYPEGVGPSGTRDILMRLYPPGGFQRASIPLYEEILNLLLRSGMGLAGDLPFLLGNHHGPPAHDPLVKEMIRQASKDWPKISVTGRVGSRFNAIPKHYRTLNPTGENVRRVFSQVLRASLGRKQGRELRKSRTPVSAVVGNGVIPNPYDRLAPARRRLGAPVTLYAQPGTMTARIPERPCMANIYLDVSGSMNYLVSYLLGLVLPYVAKDKARVFQFSTTVDPLSLADLRQGKLKTTGGTNINCVLAHWLHDNIVDRALILTDGAVGAPSEQFIRDIRERGLRMNVVLPHNRTLYGVLADLATSVVTLPPLD